MATIPRNARIEFIEQRVSPDGTKTETTFALAKDDSVTSSAPEEIRQHIADQVERSRLLAEDLLIAVRVRERLAEETGERVDLIDFVRHEGFSPADFGLE